MLRSFALVGDDVNVDTLVARAARGDAALGDELATRFATIAAGSRFVAQVCQRASDRDNVVAELLTRLRSEGSHYVSAFEDTRRAYPQLSPASWLRVAFVRATVDYVRGSDATTSSVVATEILRRASCVVREPHLSALELWAGGTSYEAIAGELELGGATDAERMARDAIELVRKDLASAALDTNCPGIIMLEDKSNAAISEHAAQCVPCRLVVDLLETRLHAQEAHTHIEECAEVEMLIAAAATNERLRRHLAKCAKCVEVAAEIAGEPVSARRIDSTYTLGREIARGGMGRILSAEDTRIGREVAVKEMLGTSPDLVTRFEREARVTARLQHPGIVPIYEIGRWPDGTPFYSMRLIEGQTLRDALRAKRSLRDRLGLLPAVIAAAEAVAFAHAKRIIHRDLTPNNVLVGAYGDTVVIDWGLAKSVGDADDASPMSPSSGEDLGLTQAGAVVGTAAYMPPEQAKGLPVDESADVYALGAMLYHVLAGAAPYSGSTNAAILEAVLRGTPPPLEDAPSDLITIVEKAMHPIATERYATARELAEDLRRFQTGQLVESHHYTLWQLTRRWLARHRAAVAIAGVMLLVLAVVLVVSVRRIIHARDLAEEQRGAAEISADRAHRAETKVQAQLDQIKAEQVARTKAEAEARASGTEAAMSKEQLAAALLKEREERGIAEHAKTVAEDESRRAREAEERAKASAASEKQLREDELRLYEQEKARVKALENAPAKAIITKLPK